MVSVKVWKVHSNSVSLPVSTCLSADLRDTCSWNMHECQSAGAVDAVGRPLVTSATHSCTSFGDIQHASVSFGLVMPDHSRAPDQRLSRLIC